MIKKLIHLSKVLLCAVLIIQMVGCGSIMYPGRRGQHGGRIDAGVAVLDGLGLLLFIIPGVIAFAVDFSTGAIYLPGSAKDSLVLKNIKVVKFDPRHTTSERIEKIIKKETGLDIKLDRASITRLSSINDMTLPYSHTCDSRSQTVAYIISYVKDSITDMERKIKHMTCVSG